MTLQQAKDFIAAYFLIPKPSSFDKDKFKIAMQVVATIRIPNE